MKKGLALCGCSARVKLAQHPALADPPYCWGVLGREQPTASPDGGGTPRVAEEPRVTEKPRP